MYQANLFTEFALAFIVWGDLEIQVLWALAYADWTITPSLRIRGVMSSIWTIWRSSDEHNSSAKGLLLRPQKPKFEPVEGHICRDDVLMWLFLQGQGQL